ncbi:MAG: NIPSNAP family protein [Bacteroidetes bacterium]|nr:NIPSNAP family protein [Bacteroidota bacterium]MBU1374204.1 NIPSNAP family protein [Bacteroidota bacterium]MBU1485916.1 NIPSNAP family protein [Bacteroidota bacterium]MBU1760031.1 NIPSNAP family protein [Bacteroidota bacterium]MBU2046095.1 NIPSNAP family protein [Bacteroidota bacterium]
MPKTILKTFTFLILLSFLTTTLKAKQAELVQIIVYHFENDAQVKQTENYLKEALIPAFHQQKIDRIGVFKPLDFAQDKRLFLIIPYHSFSHFIKVNQQIELDKNYLIAGNKYIKAAYNEAPYSRKESILLNSFSTAPILQKPNLKNSSEDKVYELRSYESATELLHQKKVEMFNDGGETKIFTRLNFNPIFYGSVIAGSKMPNLMYLTSYENMDDREAHWKAFGADEAWKTISVLPEYKNTVSKIESTFLRSTSYSDL